MTYFVDLAGKPEAPGDPEPLRLSIATDSETGELQHVSISRDDVEGRVVLGAEVIERVAAALARVRWESHDTRAVCADHGYYRLLDINEREQRCPKCIQAERALDSVERLKTE